MGGARDVTIGPLSKSTDTNIETIRYYERAGLLPVPARTSGGYRLYGTTHLKRLTTLAELANVAVFMASDQASAITGTVVNLSGGTIVD